MRKANPNSPALAKILDTAQRLVLAKGFAATTIDEICAEAGLTKGAFFHYFESKDALARRLISRWNEGLTADRDALFGDDQDPLARVLQYLDSIAAKARAGAFGRGSLLATFAAEQSESAAVRSACAEGFASWTGQLGEELARAKEAHAPRSRLVPGELAEHIVAALEGAILLARARGDGQAVARTAAHLRRYVEGLFTR